MGNTTRYSAATGGTGYAIAKGVSACQITGNAFLPAKRVWVWNTTLGAYQMVYSTPTASISNFSASSSGMSPSGSVNVSGSVSLGGFSSGSIGYNWTYVSGTAFTTSGLTSATPNWSGTVPAGSQSAVWNLVITDTVTGATYNAGNITVTLTWTNTTTTLFIVGGNSGSFTDSANGSGFFTHTFNEQAGPVPSGGIPPYAYAWTWLGTGSKDPIFCSNTAVQLPFWNSGLMGGGSGDYGLNAQWNCHVTDQSGQAVNYTQYIEYDVHVD